MILFFSSFPGKTVDAIERILDQKFSDSLWRSPSVVVLDDLEQIARAATTPEQEASGESGYYLRVAEGKC